MGSDIVPTETSGWSDVLQELNIPKLIAGPAGEAISRLVGHLVDVPSEYVKSFKQGIEDKRDARSVVSKALATAVATEAVADKDLVRRATQSFLAKELRAQTNKEAVARNAIEHLSHQSGASEPKPQTPEEDWLNVFERYAENASSEKLRDLWGRVLAKEIRSPKSFSLRTMRFVSELDVNIAQTFQNYAKSVIDGNFILKPSELQGELFNDLLRLEDAGLITGVQGNIAKLFRSEVQEAALLLKYFNTGIIVRFDEPVNLNLPQILLTNVGQEVLKIIDSADDEGEARKFAEGFPKQGVVDIAYGRLNDAQTGLIDPVIIWQRPTN
jgi:Protein of unknown function (DUF2806)